MIETSMIVDTVVLESSYFDRYRTLVKVSVIDQLIIPFNKHPF